MKRVCLFFSLILSRNIFFYAQDISISQMSRIFTQNFHSKFPCKPTSTEKESFDGLELLNNPNLTIWHLQC
jgi:hypothetical protein